MLNENDYKKALLDIHNNPESLLMLNELIEKHFAMIEHMKKTSLYDVYMYEDNITKASLEPMKILAYDNVKLKKEVNELRKQLGLCKKYKD